MLLLYFQEKCSKQLDHDEITEILDQVKAPVWHEAMVNAIIAIFEMSYEEYVPYLQRLENLKKFRCTNSPNPSSLPSTWSIMGGKFTTTKTGIRL
jgi:hypothetical protein